MRHLRTIFTLAALAVLVTLVCLSSAWLNAETDAMVEKIEATTAALRSGEGSAKDLYDEYRALYDADHPLMVLVAHKEHFAEVDVLNDQLDAYFIEGASYDDLESDLERLKSLVREIYEKTGPSVDNLF